MLSSNEAVCCILNALDGYWSSVIASREATGAAGRSRLRLRVCGMSWGVVGRAAPPLPPSLSQSPRRAKARPPYNVGSSTN